MKLYYNVFSGNARRARLGAGVLGIPLDLVPVDLTKGEQKSPAYLALNPNGRVPTLVDDGFVLWESTAIMQYLASKTPGQTLFPADPRARADIVRWQCWDLAHWAPAIRAVAFERLFKKRVGLGEPDPATVERGLKEFQGVATVLDGHLKGRDHLAGNGLTLADLSVAVGLTYAGPAGLSLDPFPNIRRWLGTIERLEAWQATAPPLGPA